MMAKTINSSASTPICRKTTSFEGETDMPTAYFTNDHRGEVFAGIHGIALERGDPVLRDVLD